MRILTTTSVKQAVVDSIIAENEGMDAPDSGISDYMQTFEGGFEPGMKFPH
ncbi:MAG: hypothetical protein LBU17_12975 [Treponema sp.]|jgi:hypothetical protein|nr:hypothetical protein [Treponema sp.]